MLSATHNFSPAHEQDQSVLAQALRLLDGDYFAAEHENIPLAISRLSKALSELGFNADSLKEYEPTVNAARNRVEEILERQNALIDEQQDKRAHPFRNRERLREIKYLLTWEIDAELDQARRRLNNVTEMQSSLQNALSHATSCNKSGRQGTQPE